VQHLFLSSSTILKLRRHSILLDLSSIVVVSYSLLTKTREIVEFSHTHRPARLPTGQENCPSHNRTRTRAGMGPEPCGLPVPAAFTTPVETFNGCRESYNARNTSPFTLRPTSLPPKRNHPNFTITETHHSFRTQWQEYDRTRMKPGGTEMLMPLDHDPPRDPPLDVALKSHMSSEHLLFPHPTVAQIPLLSLTPHNGSHHLRRSLYLQPVML